MTQELLAKEIYTINSISKAKRDHETRNNTGWLIMWEVISYLNDLRLDGEEYNSEILEDAKKVTQYANIFPVTCQKITSFIMSTPALLEISENIISNNQD